MDQLLPICLGQDTTLPYQNQAFERFVDLKAARIMRGRALYSDLLQLFPHNRQNDRFAIRIAELTVMLEALPGRVA
jgi:hypothetical protein